jgi:hypothetical protein
MRVCLLRVIQFVEAVLKLLHDILSMSGRDERLDSQPQNVAIRHHNGPQCTHDFKGLPNRIGPFLEPVKDKNPSDRGAAGNAGLAVDQERFIANLARKSDGSLDVFDVGGEDFVFRDISFHIIEIESFGSLRARETQPKFLHPGPNRKDIPTRQFSRAHAQRLIDVGDLHFLFLKSNSHAHNLPFKD